MRRAADHAMLMATKARQAEKQYARTKSVRDLTDVIKMDATTKKMVKVLTIPTEKRAGCPIGQRWA